MEGNEWREKGNSKVPSFVLMEETGCGVIRAVSRKTQELAFFSPLTTSCKGITVALIWVLLSWKNGPFDVGTDTGIHGYPPHQDNLSFLPVIQIEQTTLPDNSKQVLKLSTCISLAEFNVKHTIKFPAQTRCNHPWLTWGHSKGCKSSWSIIATTEQISLLQTALGISVFPLSTKQRHAQSQFTAA